MHWFERRIRRYEHRRWTTDDNRRVQPFHWGVEHIGGDPANPHPATYVREYAKQAIANSAEWFATTPATDYNLTGPHQSAGRAVKRYTAKEASQCSPA